MIVFTKWKQWTMKAMVHTRPDSVGTVMQAATSMIPRSVHAQIIDKKDYKLVPSNVVDKFKFMRKCTAMSDCNLSNVDDLMMDHPRGETLGATLVLLSDIILRPSAAM